MMASRAFNCLFQALSHGDLRAPRFITRAAPITRSASLQVHFIQSSLYSSISKDASPVIGNFPCSGNLIVRRYKKKKAGRAKAADDDDEKDENDEDDEDDDDDVEENPMLMEDLDDTTTPKPQTIAINSLRLDTFATKALAITRSKAEEAFFKGEIYVNGERPSKKSETVSIGDEIDLVLRTNPENHNLLDVKRVQIVSMPDKTDEAGRMKVEIRRLGEVTTEAYPDKKLS